MKQRVRLTTTATIFLATFLIKHMFGLILRLRYSSSPTSSSRDSSSPKNSSLDSSGKNCFRGRTVPGRALQKNRSEMYQATMPENYGFNPQNFKKIPTFLQGSILDCQIIYHTIHSVATRL